MSDKSDYELKMLNFMKRITLALEQLARKGEKSVDRNTRVGDRVVSMTSPTAEPTRAVEKQVSADSKPSFINTSSLAQREAQLEKTTVVESQNFVDVRECKDYSDKAYKLIGYDNLETYIAKQHVVRTESIEGGGTRVVVSQKSAWVIEKLEWK